MVYHKFTELPVYKKCREFRIEIADLIRNNFPPEEKYRLSDQLLRSSRSVTANIAEGFGRFHYLENIQFCRHSRGSLQESLEHLITAKDEKYISDEILTTMEIRFKACLSQINGYINYLKNSREGIINNK